MIACAGCVMQRVETTLSLMEWSKAVHWTKEIIVVSANEGDEQLNRELNYEENLAGIFTTYADYDNYMQNFKRKE